MLLRRTKALIAHQLPTKRDHIVFCQLSEEQLAAYRCLGLLNDAYEGHIAGLTVLPSAHVMCCYGRWKASRCAVAFL